MDKDEIQRLRDLPIESVAERLGLTVNYHKALCPFHADRHPSLSFYRSRNTYRCFVCGAHGGVIDLAMQLLSKNFPDACRWLGGNSETRNFGNSETRKDSEVSKCRSSEMSKCRSSEMSSFRSSEVSKCRSSEIPKCRNSEVSSFRVSDYGRFFEHPFLNDLAIDFLYTKRHLDARVIRWCRLNSYKEWLQIPYYDIDGKLIGVQSRYLGADKNQPRFRFPTGSHCSIYNLQVLRLLRPGEPLYIAEGCSDCWSLLSAGHKTIAIPSATLLKPQDLNILATLTSKLSTEFHMYPDQDEPGERLFQQLKQSMTSLSLTLIRHDLPPDCKDFSDFYLKSIHANQHSPHTHQ